MSTNKQLMKSATKLSNNIKPTGQIGETANSSMSIHINGEDCNSATIIQNQSSTGSHSSFMCQHMQGPNIGIILLLLMLDVMRHSELFCSLGGTFTKNPKWLPISHYH